MVIEWDIRGMPRCAVPSLGAVAFTPLNIAPMSGCCQEANHRRWALLVEGWRRKINHICAPSETGPVRARLCRCQRWRRCDGSTRRGGARWGARTRTWDSRTSVVMPAECHRHILGYLKIDLSAMVCARACTLLRRGCLFIIVSFSTLSFFFYPTSHAVLQ